MAGGILALVAPILVIAGVAGVGGYALRRWGRGLTGREAPIPLGLLHQFPIGPRQRIGLLRVGDRVLVVSVSEHDVRVLTELAGETLARALAAFPTAERPKRLLWTVALVAALAATPAAQVLAAPVARQKAGAAVVQRPPAGLLPGVGPKGDIELKGAVGIAVLIGALTLLPTLFLMMTSFTRIVVVLHFLRFALGTQAAPPGQLLVAIAVLLTGVVMGPTLDRANREALQPYLAGELSQAQAYRNALVPFREFMLANTRDETLAMFAEVTHQPAGTASEQVPTTTLMGAFITSELSTAFQIGFVIFLPFVVIDLIVASVLVSMGMFMLPPAMVSVPFKLLLFVLADGWDLVVQNLIAGFRA
jgi:flagellar biosynthetic protein FliP